MTSSTEPGTISTKRRGPYQRRKRLRAEPVRFVDEGGRECLRVPLDRQGRQFATATAAGYQAVREAGASGTWLLNRNGTGRAYVRTWAGETLLMPARIIAGAGAHSVVRYVNGDPCDLRPENIVLRRGRAKRADYDIARGDATDAGDR